MQRSPVDSKALLSVGYCELTQSLEIEFRSGSVYRYLEVPRTVYEWLLRTPNKGVFVARQVTGRYAYESVPSVPATPPEALEAALRDSLVRR